MDQEEISMTDSNNSQNDTELTIKFQKELFPEWNSDITTIRKDSQYRKRGKDKTIRSIGASVTTKKDGSVSMVSGHGAASEQKSPLGIVTKSSTREDIKTNVYSVDAEDVIINNHKLNNKLYELADFKKVLDGYDKTPSIVGGLTMLGTVLVKAWEPNLKRYVLVRRQINIPMFSPSIGGPQANPGLKVENNDNSIMEMVEAISSLGLTSYAQLATKLEEQRKEAILKQEESTTAKMKALIEEVSKQQTVSMTTITGQNAAQMGGSSSFMMSPSAMSSNTVHGGGGGSFGVVENASQFSDGYQWMDPTGTNKDARNQCASFASQMMKKAGIDIEVCVNGNVLADQFKAVGAYHKPGDGYQPQAGDLIDWAHHVGIYAGNGEYIARNSSGGVKRGSMNGMERYFGSLWGFGSISELQRAKGHTA